MAIFFPQSEQEWRRQVEGLLRQHHTDVQRLWGRVPQPSTLTPSVAPDVPTPATMEGGGNGEGGGNERRLARVWNDLNAGLSQNVDLCDDDWEITGERQAAVNAFPYYILVVSGETTRVVIEKWGDVWHIVWCEYPPYYRGLIGSGNHLKGSTPLISLLQPGTESGHGATVRAINRYGDIIVPSGTGNRRIGVFHDGVEYVITSAEC